MRNEYKLGDKVIITRKIHQRTKTEPLKFVEQPGVFFEYSGSARAWIMVNTASGPEKKSFPLVNIRPKEIA